MQEFSPTPSTPEVLATHIARVTREWVHEEALESINDRNKYLGDYLKGHEWLQMEYLDPLNLPASKHSNHHNRQRFWGNAHEIEPDNDFAAGRHLFNILMQVSGLAKRLCYVKATSMEHYFGLKTDPGVIGIDPFPVVLGKIMTRQAATPPNLLALDVPELQTATLDQFSEIKEDFDGLRDDIEADFGQPESPTVGKLRAIQMKWVRLVTDGVLTLMANRDGRLIKVPVLQPKSISDEPEVYYPFDRVAR